MLTPFGHCNITFHSDAIDEMKLVLNITPCAKTGPSEEQKFRALKAFAAKLPFQEEKKDLKRKAREVEMAAKKLKVSGENVGETCMEIEPVSTVSTNESGEEDEFEVLDEYSVELENQKRLKRKEKRALKKEMWMASRPTQQKPNSGPKKQSALGFTPQGTHRNAPKTKPGPSMHSKYNNTKVKKKKKVKS